MINSAAFQHLCIIFQNSNAFLQNWTRRRHLCFPWMDGCSLRFLCQARATDIILNYHHFYVKIFFNVFHSHQTCNRFVWIYRVDKGGLVKGTSYILGEDLFECGSVGGSCEMSKLSTFAQFNNFLHDGEQIDAALGLSSGAVVLFKENKYAM